MTDFLFLFRGGIGSQSVARRHSTLDAGMGQVDSRAGRGRQIQGRRTARARRQGRGRDEKGDHGRTVRRIQGSRGRLSPRQRGEPGRSHGQCPGGVRSSRQADRWKSVRSIRWSSSVRPISGKCDDRQRRPVARRPSFPARVGKDGLGVDARLRAGQSRSGRGRRPGNAAAGDAAVAVRRRAGQSGRLALSGRKEQSHRHDPAPADISGDSSPNSLASCNRPAKRTSSIGCFWPRRSPTTRCG